MTSDPKPTMSSDLNDLRPPPPFTVRVSSLRVRAPPARWTIPLAVPITIPKRVQAAIIARRGHEAPEPKELLKGVSLVVQPGEVLAIIGGSGSGKTTLLNAVACRLGNLEVVKGSVGFVPANSGRQNEADGAVKELGLDRRKGVNKVIGFVRQDDFLLPYLTVRETLTFAARLRLPSSVSHSARKAIVEQTILELGLLDAADTIVGGPFRKGISGGEKRRLSIGCILVTLPSVLVLDEPTTGLDSSTAIRLLETLSNLARRGRTIILSIHQPRSDAVQLFDRVTLLSTGCAVYSRPTSEMMSYFTKLGYQSGEFVNPLDFVIDISSVDTRDDELERTSRARVDTLICRWREQKDQAGVATPSSATLSTSSEPIDLEKGIQKFISPEQSTANHAADKRANWMAQTGLLTSRALKNISRNYGQNIGFLAQALLIGVAIGCAFYKPPETPGGIQTLKTIVFQSTPAFYYLSIVIFCFLYASELIIFDREREDNLYGTVPWVLASFLSLLPAAVITPTVYSVIIYFMTGFRTDNLAVNLLSFIAQGILQQMAAMSYALLCTSINRSFAQASLLANGFSIVFVLTSGYLIIGLPSYIKWTRWVSPYFYGFNWIARTQFTDRSFACEGVTGAARNACEGNNVLVGFRFHLSSPLYIYPLGLLGFVIGTYSLATLLLIFYHPGGVKYAAANGASVEQVSLVKEKEDRPALPSSERVRVVVENLTLEVRKRSVTGAITTKVILEGVDAVFPAGEVSCIMGPSGAGKSSLLQLLAGRVKSGPLSDFRSTGSVLLNGQEIDPAVSSLLAFMAQEDTHHLPALTVRETLQYAARLSLRDHTKAEAIARAEEVLRTLGLKSCADSMVGGELLKGISGGEKRRLSLGIQLIVDPAVILADEPLSGLDAFTARNVMETLRDIATSGRTVIVSVHQPRSDIWSLFDNVLLLVRGGRTGYSGSRTNVLKFLDGAGSPCPEHFNPADHLLDVVNMDYRSPERIAESEARISGVLSTWSKEADSYRVEIHGSGKTRVDQKQGSSPFLTALPVVLGRSSKNLRRQQDAFVARIANPPFMALLFFLFFARLNLGPAGAQNRVGLLQETTAVPFVGMLACLAIFPSEKNLFLHERRTAARHSVSTFLLAYTVQEILVSIVSSFMFSLVFVFGINLQHTARNFLEFWLASFCLVSVGESFGIIFTASFNNGGIAVSLVSAGITILAQLNGIISVTLPQWLKVIGWISPMKPQAQLQLINEMKGLVFRCTQAEIASGACIAATGEQLLTTFGLASRGTGELVGILLALTVLWRLFALLALHLKVLSI